MPVSVRAVRASADVVIEGLLMGGAGRGGRDRADRRIVLRLGRGRGDRGREAVAGALEPPPRVELEIA